MTRQSPGLWCATSATQLAAIARSGWRDWPDQNLHTTSSLEAATAAARALAQAQGVGHIVRLDVTITERAHYRGGQAEAELDAAEAALGRRIPATWRSYLRGQCWFHRGWMLSGAYVWLYPAMMSVELASVGDCPEMFVIGGDGAGEQLVLDLREESPQVRLANVVCSGWEETFVQAASLKSFLNEVEAGTFEFSFS